MCPQAALAQDVCRNRVIFAAVVTSRPHSLKMSRICSAGVPGLSRQETGRRAQEALFYRARMRSPTKSRGLSPSKVFSIRSTATVRLVTSVSEAKRFILPWDRTESFRQKQSARRPGIVPQLIEVRLQNRHAEYVPLHLPRDGLLAKICQGNCWWRCAKRPPAEKTLWPRRLRQNLSPVERTPGPW